MSEPAFNRHNHFGPGVIGRPTASRPAGLVLVPHRLAPTLRG